MNNKISESLENYLRAIYILHIDGKVPRVKDVSSMLSVRNASAVEAIKKLESAGYVRHEKYGYIDLTDEGLNAAEGVYRKYITLVDFFVNTLNISKDKSYKLACGVEHHMTDDFYVSIEALTLFLKKNPMQFKRLQEFIKVYNKDMPHLFRTTIIDMEVGYESDVISVSGSKEMKEKIFKLGVFPGVNFMIKNKNENNVELDINSKTIVLSNEEAKYIIVE